MGGLSMVKAMIIGRYWEIFEIPIFPPMITVICPTWATKKYPNPAPVLLVDESSSWVPDIFCMQFFPINVNKQSKPIWANLSQSKPLYSLAHLLILTYSNHKSTHGVYSTSLKEPIPFAASDPMSFKISPWEFTKDSTSTKSCGQGSAVANKMPWMR